MLKPKIIIPQRLLHQQSMIRGEEFGVLCWNTQKLTQTLKFQVTLARLLEQFPSQILLFQEAKLALGSGWKIPD